MSSYSLSIFLVDIFRTLAGLFTRKKKPVESLYGISFDDGVQMSELPVRSIIELGKFCKLSDQVGFIEILEIDNENHDLRIREICTDNEFTIDIELFNFLFVEAECPAECKF